jgi:chromate transporter
MDASSPPATVSPNRQPPSARDIFLAFTKLGITSFGGGVSGMMHSEFVVKRGWFSEEEFLSGLAISQALPGVNVANLSIWLGYQCRGTLGALIALIGVVLPPAVVIVLIGDALFRLSAYPSIGALLAGVAAAATGLSLSVGVRAGRHASRDTASILLFAATLIGALVFHFSAIVLVGVFAPIGIGLAFARARREQG